MLFNAKKISFSFIEGGYLKLRVSVANNISLTF